MKSLYDSVSAACSRTVTNRYSTSFSLGIRFLAGKFHAPVYAIYGFVRLADEIVDSFHGYEKKALLDRFRSDTNDAIEHGISLNPILNSFQQAVRTYGIEPELIETFFESMYMDLDKHGYSRKKYDRYILGSAESVGLMCLRVFCAGDARLYESLKDPASRLGAAFQKVNFLRDMKADKELLGRVYFPGVDFATFGNDAKRHIEDEIQSDFTRALEGIRRLPHGSRAGVYLAYYYYLALFRKIRSLPADTVKSRRIRVSNPAKMGLMIHSLIKYRLNLI